MKRFRVLTTTPMNSALVLIVFLLSCAPKGAVAATVPADYSHDMTPQPNCNKSGVRGVYCWADSFSSCGEGGFQSPVNLNQAKPTPGLEPIAASRHGTCTVAGFRNTGHTWSVDFSHACSGVYSVEFAHHEYELDLLEFRSPSEHLVGGGSMAGEVQLHYRLGVAELNVAILVEERADKTGTNAFLDLIWGFGSDPQTAKANVLTGNWSVVSSSFNIVDVKRHIRVADLLGGSGSYYSYNGSQTSPPCSRGVQWVVLADPIGISPSQLAIFRRSMYRSHGNVSNINVADHYANTRPTQPLRGRRISFFSGHAPSHESEHEEEHEGFFFESILAPLGSIFAFVGVCVMVFGGCVVFCNLVGLGLHKWGLLSPDSKLMFSKRKRVTLRVIQGQFAKALVVSLEFLIGADVIETLARPVRAQTFSGLGLISIIVAVRTVLALHIGHELAEISKDPEVNLQMHRFAKLAILEEPARQIHFPANRKQRIRTRVTMCGPQSPVPRSMPSQATCTTTRRRRSRYVSPESKAGLVSGNDVKIGPKTA